MTDGAEVIQRINEVLYSSLRLPLETKINLNFLYLDLSKPDVFRIPIAGQTIPIPGLFLMAAALTQFLSSKMMAPVTKMHTLGHSFVPAGVHAGGLRYHGMAPLVSALVEAGYIQGSAYPQNAVFEAAVQFARTEGIVPAPETAHAIRAVVDVALRCREAGERRVILFNFSGHGHFDLAAYDAYLRGDLPDYELPDAQIAKALKELPKVE